MKTHDNQKPFQCTVCNRGYNTAAALTSHMQNHKKAGDSASNGGASNGRSSSRASSENTPSPGTFRCLQCGDCFRKAEDLQSHMAGQHHVDMGSPPSRSASRGLLLDSPLSRSPFPLPTLSCMYCTKDSFGSMEALQLHVQAMHGALLNGELRDLAAHAARSRPSVDDPLRGSPTTPSPSGPTTPGSTGSGGGAIPCELCTMRFNSVSGLHKHQRSVHGLVGPKFLGDPSPILCVHCSLPFPSSAAFAEHYVLVHGGGASPAALAALAARSPSPSPAGRDREQQEKPTDLSVSRKASSRRGADDKSHLGMPPSKRSKSNHDHPPLLLDGLMGRDYEAGPLLCNQCGAALPDFEAFRVHLKAHLEESGAGLRSLLGADLLGLLPPAPAGGPLGPLGSLGPPPAADEPLPGRSAFLRLTVRSIVYSHRRSPASASPGAAGHGLSCPHCGVQFPTSTSEDRIGVGALLERHVAEHFLATATEFGCPTCSKLFAKPDELQKHLMDIHAHHLYRCALCQELFDSKVAIQVHFAVKHSSACPLFRCTACPSSSASSVFRSDREFGLHVRTAHATHPLLAATHAMLLQFQQKLQQREQRDLQRDREQRDREQRERDREQRDRERERDRDRDRDRERERDREVGREAETPGQQPFRCLFCRASFGSELELQFHLPTHTRQYSCPLCQETFQVEFLLDKHMQTQHSGQINGRDTPPGGEGKAAKPNGCTNGDAPDPLLNNNQAGASCDICERGDFASEAELAAHRKLAHHKNGQGATTNSTTAKNGAVSLLCAYCNESCKSRTELENHMKTHSHQGTAGLGGTGKHKCNICDELCPSAAVLAEHKLTHCKVVQGSACTVCRASVTTEEQFRSHLRQHAVQTGGNPQPQVGGASAPLCLPVQCVICRQTLVSDVEVRLHARFHLQTGGAAGQTAEQPTGSPDTAASAATCCICLQSGDAASMASRTSSPSRQSQDDGKQESRGATSVTPEKSAASQDATTPQRCGECGVKTESAAALEAHMAAAHKNTYQCIKCQASFETERDIRLHVSAHLLAEGSAANECRLCRRQLSTPLQLQLHLIEHTFAGCASFTCYICSAVFTAARGLQAHMLEHGLSARPYDCSHCGLRFFFRAELDNHTLGHHAQALAHASMQARPGDDDEAAQASFYQHLSSLSNSNGLDLHYYTVPPGGEASAAKSPRKSPGRSNGRDRDRDGRGAAPGPKQRCLICGKDMPSARALAAHLRSSHGVQDNGLGLAHGLDSDLQVCLLCKEVLPDRDALLVHLAVQHPGPGLTPGLVPPLQLEAHMALLSQAHSLQQMQHVKQEPAPAVVKEEAPDEETSVSSVPAEERATSPAAVALPSPTATVATDEAAEDSAASAPTSDGAKGEGPEEVQAIDGKVDDGERANVNDDKPKGRQGGTPENDVSDN
ncbi:Zinc finger protein-like [Frankliniella occidentalis]|nr:Zinc finger protein-like [Frankliniella occidentalis]